MSHAVQSITNASKIQSVWWLDQPKKFNQGENAIKIFLNTLKPHDNVSDKIYLLLIQWQEASYDNIVKLGFTLSVSSSLPGQGILHETRMR